MTATALQNAGILANFTPGESGWDDEMEKNLRKIDCLLQPNVIDKDLATPPGSPADGATYIVAASATGVWTGYSTKIARYNSAGSAWEMFTPKAGWRAYVADEDEYYRYTGSAWAIESRAQPVDIYASINGTLPATAKIMVPTPLARVTIFPINFAGALAKAQVAATASTVLNVKRDGTTIGTITFAAAGTTGTFATTGGVAMTFTAGQTLAIEGPSTADTTLGTVGIVLVGSRAGV